MDVMKTDAEVAAAGKRVVEPVVDRHVKQVWRSYTPLADPRGGR